MCLKLFDFDNSKANTNQGIDSQGQFENEQALRLMVNQRQNIFFDFQYFMPNVIESSLDTFGNSLNMFYCFTKTIKNQFQFLPLEVWPSALYMLNMLISLLRSWLHTTQLLCCDHSLAEVLTIKKVLNLLNP